MSHWIHTVMHPSEASPIFRSVLGPCSSSWHTHSGKAGEALYSLPMKYFKFSSLIISALIAFTATQGRADNFVTITPTGANAATVANRWAIGSDMSGLGYIDGNSGFPGATATNFFTINGAAIPALGNPTGFTSYLPTGAASSQASVGNSLTPDSYSGLTYVADNLSLIGPLSFYAIHHRITGDYLALIQPSVPTVSDQKPMSVPGGPLTAGANGYFALSYAADNPGGWGAELFYYLRTNGLGETVFGSMIPALLSGPTDRWNLGAGRGFTDLAYTSTNVVGMGASQFFYLRLDPITQTTFFGRLDPLTGTATDIQNLGGVYRTLVFTPTNVAYGANLFYSIGQSSQTITFAGISDHTACDAPFTFVYPLASSGLPVTLAVSGPATVSDGNVITLTGVVGTVTLTASQAGNTILAPAPNVTQSFAVGTCKGPAPVCQRITFASIPNHTACDVPFAFVYPLASSGLPVLLAVSGPATISGDVITLTGAVGTVTLTASQGGNPSFSPAPTVTQSFAVAACACAQPPTTTWLSADIGNVGIAGSDSVAAGTFTVSGSGADIWDTIDAFHFVYQPLHGDGEIIAQVTSLDQTDAFAKAGVMFRESPTADSRNAFAFLTADEGAAFQTRADIGGATNYTEGPWWVSAPYWVKLVRSGNVFNAYTSADGATWDLVSSETVVMATDLYVGLAVTAHNNSTLNTATFANFLVN
jgi:hypothetical protein